MCVCVQNQAFWHFVDRLIMTIFTTHKHTFNSFIEYNLSQKNIFVYKNNIKEN